MKYLSIILLSACVFTGCQNAGSEQEETTATTDITPAEEGAMDFYGEEISPEGAKDMAWLSENTMSGDSVQVKVAGEITSTCPMKGCWMKLSSPEGDIRVTFKDYGFFVPKEGVEGKEAVIEGVATRRMIDVETLRHMAEDAGKSEAEIAAITEPREELIMEATGVVIR